MSILPSIGSEHCVDVALGLALHLNERCVFIVNEIYIYALVDIVLINVRADAMPLPQNIQEFVLSRVRRIQRCGMMTS